MSGWEEDQAQLRRFADGEHKQIHSGNWQGWFGGPDLELIPPLAERFTVSGNSGTVERAREWALGGRYLLADGPPVCAHGLLMLRCPKMGRVCCPAFDHTSIWVPADQPHEPFILTDPYQDEVPDGIRTYAGAHGLRVTSHGLDRWYDEDAIPIRLTASQTEFYSWPLGTASIVMVSAFPVRWPDPDPDDVPWGLGAVPST
jgi:hypothetical protein